MVSGRSEPLRKAIQIVAFVLMGVILTFTAAEADESWKKESAQWLEAIEPGERVRVVNPLGDIRARFGGYENQVEILATLQYTDQQTSLPEVSLNRIDGGLDVSTHWTQGEGAGRGRVDLVVFVPQGATLDARTEDGLLEAKGLKSDLIASSLQGEIRIRSIRGSVNAKSSRGAISTALESGATEQPQAITTETGDIEVYLWEDAAMQVRLATSGEISTDFSIEIDHRRFEEPGKHGRATIGKGGPQLVLESKRGRVRLLRQQRDFDPQD
jgi:hypothetical protein